MSTMHHKLSRSASLPNIHSPNFWPDDIDAAQSTRALSQLPLPVELLDRIVFEAWISPLGRDERIQLATSLPLVSHNILDIFIRIAMRDVHILTPQYAQHYLALVRPRSFFSSSESPLTRQACQIAHRLCRSLTFHISASPLPDSEPAIRLYADGDRGAESVSSTLYLLSLVPVFVPNLRRVRLQYTDWGFDDVLDGCRLLPMPAQVERLELCYSFSSEKLRRVADQARDFYDAASRWTNMRWGMEQVKYLTVQGAPARFVDAVTEMCTELETLEVDKYVEMDGKWVIPKGLKALTLVDDLPSTNSMVIDWWGLARSMNGDALVTSKAVGSIMLAAPWRHFIGRQRLRRMCMRDNVMLECASTTASS